MQGEIMRHTGNLWIAGPLTCLIGLVSTSATAQTPGQDQASFSQEISVKEPIQAGIEEPNPHMKLNGGAPITAGESASGAFKYLVKGLGPMEITFDESLRQGPDGAEDHADLKVPGTRQEFVTGVHVDDGEVTAKTDEEAPSGSYQWEVTVTASYDW
ncbi:MULTISPECIES: hypothetical protein [Halorhodospira]|uniref:hypothetical protein n=1 Tax=Halorhodospira TaxID=85108 RepID=UPI001EE9135E|nr:MULTISPECIES: hypothetical protein [Halorhodospira]MCG5528539.1 hypothetical protein [Halorhodospira halophila]MCG5543798.1 hypothetical protein [Halorhodospira sp. 9628]